MSKRAATSRFTLSTPIPTFPAFLAATKTTLRCSKNQQLTQGRPLVQRGEIPNISHMKRNGDRLRAGEGGQEEEKKIGTGLEIAGRGARRRKKIGIWLEIAGRGEKEGKKIGIWLEITRKERACGKGVGVCLFHVSPKQQGTKSTERQGKKNN